MRGPPAVYAVTLARRRGPKIGPLTPTSRRKDADRPSFPKLCDQCASERGGNPPDQVITL